MGRIPAGHEPTGVLAPAPSISPQSANATSVFGATVDLAGKRGAYFLPAQGVLTGLATVAFYLQEADTDSNGSFTNVNTTTYPEATLAASNAANASREMGYQCGAGRKQFVRAVVAVATNAAIVSCSAASY